MKTRILIFVISFFVVQTTFGQADINNYLSNLKKELIKEWPKNKTINLVFHGHSVPTGYFKTPFVNTLQAYPFLSFKAIKEKYPSAVINFIVTGIGGENSVSGEKRFETTVLNHKPDVLFIDYALNDRIIGLEKSTIAMTKMIELGLKKGIKIILLTPTPHQSYNLLDPKNEYEQYKDQVIALAKKYNLGLVDSYGLFKTKLLEGHQVSEYMSQVNHPNELGHQLIALEIAKWF